MPLADINGYLQHDYVEPREEAYTIAVNRTRKPYHSSHSEADTSVVYDLANHITQFMADRRHVHTQTMLETCLYEHIERWKSETKHWSSMGRRIAHPSYLRIIGLAKNVTNYKVERALLQELQKKPSHWFAALTALTGENPIRPEHTFDEAVAAWLAWGREQGII